jgi:hypothetical protein
MMKYERSLQSPHQVELEFIAKKGMMKYERSLQSPHQVELEFIAKNENALICRRPASSRNFGLYAKLSIRTI